jgi:hypothetical protein
VEVLRRLGLCGGDEMRQPSVRPSLYTPEATEGHGTRDIAINFVSRGGRRPLGMRGITMNVA